MLCALYTTFSSRKVCPGKDWEGIKNVPTGQSGQHPRSFVPLKLPPRGCQLPAARGAPAEELSHWEQSHTMTRHEFLYTTFTSQHFQKQRWGSLWKQQSLLGKRRGGPPPGWTECQGGCAWRHKHALHIITAPPGSWSSAYDSHKPHLHCSCTCPWLQHESASNSSLSSQQQSD